MGLYVVLLKQVDNGIHTTHLQLDDHEYAGMHFAIGPHKLLKQWDGLSIGQCCSAEIDIGGLCDGKAIEGRIVIDHQLSVSPLMYIELRSVDDLLKGFTEGCQRVLRKAVARPASPVSD